MRSRNLLNRLRQEPVALFLLVAMALFVLNGLFSPAAAESDNPRIIEIDREALLRFAQFRSRVFNEQGVSAAFDSMPQEEKKRLFDDLVREEALYREAVSWGLDRDDYVIRRRLVQSLEFAMGNPDADAAVDDAAVRAFYRDNRSLYAEAPTISFTHVFFSFGKGGEPGARHRAATALAALNRGRIDPAATGDRFLYHVNYADQGADMIRSHFGEPMAADLFKLKPGEAWQGPFASPHGIHLVKLIEASPGRTPPLEEIRAAVTRDAAQALAAQQQAAAVAKIIASYRVSPSSELKALR